ncbi:MAG: MDR/zinc-dependent alcohol dehydrogenase-like family protein [Fimbriimonadaceae bacterium]
MAVLKEPGRFELERSEDLADLRPDEVRIDLEGCGVCGSDMAVWNGAPWFEYPLAPGAPGHEGWGRVAEVGEEVSGFAPGDRVAAMSFNAYADFDVAKASQIVRLPAELNDMPYFPGEPLGCAMNVFERSGVEPGMKVAVVGVGFLGLILTNLYMSAGAEVIAISRRPYALDLAQDAGAKHAIRLNGDDHAVMEQVSRLTHEQGCDVALEATGKAGPLNLAGELPGNRGRLVIAGFHQDGPREIDFQSWNWRGIDVINAHERDPERYVSGIRRAVDAIVKGKLRLRDVYTVFPLTQINEAFRTTEERPDGFIKAVVTT